MILQSYRFNWQWFVSWFLDLPLFGQILVAIGIFTIITLLLVGIYYLLKGIAYLIYYICKGIYYIFKGIAIGIYKLFNGIYHLIVGKKQSDNVETGKTQVSESKVESIPPIPKTQILSPEIVKYCPECGVEVTELMVDQLNRQGYVYCVFCGKKFAQESSNLAQT
jgi:hypothetical protein